jgi:quercetin dioxygenase-like cupin family protein
MNVETPAIAIEDHRGKIIDIVKKTDFEYATIITSTKGAVRANHYHKETIQYLYVLNGRLRSVVQMPGQPASEKILAQGDMVVNEPYEAHAFEALEDSSFIVLTRGPRGGEDYEKDTFRLEVPLIPYPA